MGEDITFAGQKKSPAHLFSKDSVSLFGFLEYKPSMIFPVLVGLAVRPQYEKCAREIFRQPSNDGKRDDAEKSDFHDVIMILWLRERPFQFLETSLPVSLRIRRPDEAEA